MWSCMTVEAKLCGLPPRSRAFSYGGPDGRSSLPLPRPRFLSAPPSTCTLALQPPYYTLHQHRLTHPTPHTSPFLRPIALPSYHPTPTHESSAPRRRLDIGASPCSRLVAAVARPWQCPSAELPRVADRPRRCLPGGASGQRPTGGLLVAVVGMPGCLAAGHRRSASTIGCPPNPVRRPGSRCPAVRIQVSSRLGSSPSSVQLWLPRPDAAVRPAGVRPVRRPAGWCLSAGRSVSSCGGRVAAMGDTWVRRGSGHGWIQSSCMWFGPVPGGSVDR